MASHCWPLEGGWVRLSEVVPHGYRLAKCMNHSEPWIVLSRGSGGSALTLHRGPCVLVMPDAIRHSSSLLNSPGIYYMGPGRFPFQIAIDFTFKSVSKDCSNSGFNSAGFLCPWMLRMGRVGKAAEDKDNFVAHQVVRGHVLVRPPVWLPHSSAPNLELREDIRILSCDGNRRLTSWHKASSSDPVTAQSRLIQRLESRAEHAAVCRNLPAGFPPGHTVRIFIIRNKSTMDVPLSGGQEERRVGLSQIQFLLRFF